MGGGGGGGRYAYVDGFVCTCASVYACLCLLVCACECDRKIAVHQLDFDLTPLLWTLSKAIKNQSVYPTILS